MREKDEYKVRDFLKTNQPTFLAACEAAGIPATRRQASKWLRGMGIAYKGHKGII